MNELVIYSDGGCSGNPGPGGWGYVIVEGLSASAPHTPTSDAKETVGSGGDKMTTNNRMELSAVIEALSYVKKNPLWNGFQISLFTDSQYVQKGISQWITSWKRNGWKTASKEPVKNKDLWVSLDTLVSELSVRWVWVKGHAGIHYNEICDELTQREIENHR